MNPEGVLHKLQLPTTYAETTSTHYPDTVPDEEDIQSNTYIAELLQIHHKFLHFSFCKIIEMSNQGVIPEILGKENIRV